MENQHLLLTNVKCKCHGNILHKVVDSFNPEIGNDFRFFFFFLRYSNLSQTIYDFNCFIDFSTHQFPSSFHFLSLSLTLINHIISATYIENSPFKIVSITRWKIGTIASLNPLIKLSCYKNELYSF